VQRYLKLVPSERLENAMLSFADSFRAILCQRLLLDDSKGKRFAIHELLLPYDSVCGTIRRGEFKKLDHELEAGMSRGMQSFERSLQMREYDGWKPAFNRPSGFAEHEVYDYLQKEQIITQTHAVA
jgi:twitching motility protein PilT